MSDEYARTLPHAKQLVIPGVGHMPPLEASETFGAALTAFLAA
jgi:pimeloyl-ACP methyl ester carboxylesterase